MGEIVTAEGQLPVQPDGFLLKPLTRVTMRALIQQLAVNHSDIVSSKLAADIRVRDTEDVEDSRESASDDAASLSPPFNRDRATVFQLLQGEALADVVFDYVASTREHLQTIDAAFAARDGPLVRETLHAMRGAATSFVADPLCERLVALSTVVQIGQWQQHRVKSVKREVQRLIESLLLETASSST